MLERPNDSAFYCARNMLVPDREPPGECSRPTMPTLQ